MCWPLLVNNKSCRNVRLKVVVIFLISRSVFVSSSYSVSGSKRVLFLKNWEIWWKIITLTTTGVCGEFHSIWLFCAILMHILYYIPQTNAWIFVRYSFVYVFQRTVCALWRNVKLACGYFCTDINIDISILVCMAVFHLSKPVSDSILKPVSVCMCKCGRFGFGAGALATRVTTFLLPLNVSAKTFTLYSHMCLIMFYMQNYR